MISIVIPVYNAEPYLEDTLNSIFAQDYQDWELLLVDDCSKDNSVQKIEQILTDHPQYRERVQVLRQEKNAGAAVARNMELDAAMVLSLPVI